MQDRLTAPTLDQLVGDWYLIASTAGFLDTRPRVDTIAVTVTARGHARMLLSVVAELPRRRYRLSRTVGVPRATGRFSWGIFDGASFVMRHWRMHLTPDERVLVVSHDGSLVVTSGSLFFVRTSLTADVARREVEQHAGTLGLLPRAVETLSWRARPTPAGAPPADAPRR